MASDNKDDSTPTENQDSSAGESTAAKAADNVPEKVADSSASSSSKKEPPVLSDTVPDASTASAKPKAKPEPETKTKSVPSAPSAKEKKSGSVVGWLALLIALLALAGVAYGLWTLQQESKAKDTQQDRLSQSQSQLVESFKSSTQVLSSQVQGFISKSEDQQQRITGLQTQLQATTRQIGEVTQVSRRSWMLAEAEYLLRLANQRLLMERETTSALALLNSADQILVRVAEPGLFDVRETLARETTALRAVAHLDVEGVFVRLAALSEQVESLALLTPEGDLDAVVTAEGVPVPEQSSVFAGALERFSDMVTIRRRDEPLAPLLTPEQHYYVQQNLRLMLEQAQLALLQRNPGIYTRSLEKAASWVDEYFQLNEAAQALLASLRELQQLHVNPELPDISVSLALLKAYLSNPMPGAQLQPITSQPDMGSSEQQSAANGVAQ